MAKKRFNNRPPMPPVPPVPPTPTPPDKPHFHFPHRHWKPNNHNADFAPMLLHPRIPHHFNFWCNKIIPLAYDDSLSYYEVLAKTTDYLNNMLNDEKMLAINVEELAQCFCELQRFVNDYFSFYQSKGLIVYDFAITSENYEKYLPDADTAQMNTLYRIKFVEGAEQNITSNLPENAKPYSGAECLLFNVSNFDLRRYGNQWQEVLPTENGYSTKENYQLFITDKDIFFRENNGDTWGAWNSIFANWWESTYADVQAWVRALVQDVSDTLNAKIDAEIARAAAAEQVLDGKIEAETARAIAAENVLSVRLVAEYERAAAAEEALDDKIDDETTRAMDVEDSLRAALQAEVTRATTAEAANATAIQSETTRALTAESNLSDRITSNSSAITAETTRATTAENDLSSRITAEVARATAAENANASAITAETSRATTAENTLSSRIADWESDLADEREDRTQADTNLSNRITAEVNRATAAEQANATAIQGNTTAIQNEVSRATTAEQAIRDGYVPNAGNTVNGDFTLNRANITLQGNAYYDDGTYSTASEKEIAVKGDLAAITGGYIPNAGNTTNDNLVIQRNTFKLSGGNNLHVESWGGGVILGDAYLYDGLFVNESITKIKTRNLDFQGGEDVYFHNGRDITLRAGRNVFMDGTGGGVYIRPIGPVEITPTGNVTINPTGTVSVKGYIPNAGNTTADSFTLSRDQIYMEARNGGIRIDSDGWVIVENADGYFGVVTNNDDDVLRMRYDTTPSSTEYYLFGERGVATLKCDELLQNCPTLFHSYNQSNEFSAQLLNQDVAQSNVAADITIDESELYSEMKWNCCTFAFTNNAKLNLNGGRMTFENCVFSGTGKVIIDAPVYALYVTFINCVFETDVEVGEHDINKVIFKNCRFGHLFAKGRYTVESDYGLHIIDGCFINTLELETDFNTAGNCINYMISNNRIVTKQITGLGDITTQYYFNNHEGSV